MHFCFIFLLIVLKVPTIIKLNPIIDFLDSFSLININANPTLLNILNLSIATSTLANPYCNALYNPPIDIPDNTMNAKLLRSMLLTSCYFFIINTIIHYIIKTTIVLIIVLRIDNYIFYFYLVAIATILAL